MHMAMTEFERATVRTWLLEQRGDVSQAVLADDITRKTGWRITRDRYSKYESGSAPFGPAVLQHFIDYWTGEGRPGPDLTPPKEPEPVPALATALMALARELEENRKERAAMAARLEEMDSVLRALVAPTIEGEGGRGVRAGGGR